MKEHLRVLLSSDTTEPEDWTEYNLTLTNEICIEIQILQDGFFHEEFKGWTVQDITLWAQYDPTGDHPEEWHEIFDSRSQKWAAFLPLSEIKKILQDSQEKKSQEKEQRGLYLL